MNVQMNKNLEVVNQIMAWYDEVYPHMEEQAEAVTPMYELCGKRINQTQFEVLKETAYATYDIKLQHREHVLENHNVALDTYLLLLRDKKTGKEFKRYVRKWTHMSKNKIDEMKIFVF